VDDVIDCQIAKQILHNLRLVDIDHEKVHRIAAAYSN